MNRRLRIITTGSAGSATGQDDTLLPVTGFLEAVLIDYQNNPPGTTVFTLTERDTGRQLLSITGNTDAVRYPRVQAQDTSGANIAGVYTPIFISGQILRGALSVSDPLDPAAVIDLIISEGRPT